MYLLDTHALLWWLENSKQQSPRVRDIISNPSLLIFVSAASIWEISIKQSLNKIILPKDFYQKVSDEKFEHLDITHAHTWLAGNLPKIHNDPFDRLIVAQALSLNLAVITSDKYIPQYGVRTLQ